HLDAIAVLAAGAVAAFAWSSISGAVAGVLGPLMGLQRALGATSAASALYAVAARAAGIATRGLTAALLANPFTALLVAVTAVVAAIVAFGDEVKVTEDGAVSLKDAFFAALSLIGDAVRYASAFFVEAWGLATSAVTALFEV